MKVITVKVYTAKELKRYRPSAFKRAYAEYLDGQQRRGGIGAGYHESPTICGKSSREVIV